MRLEEMPKTGKVVLGHPMDEEAARLAGEYWEEDYFLHKYCPPDKVFLMDMDLICPPFL